MSLHYREQLGLSILKLGVQLKYLILIIVVIPLLDSTALMGIGVPNIGWDIIRKVFFCQYVTADFSSRDNGILFMLIFLILIAFIYTDPHL